MKRRRRQAAGLLDLPAEVLDLILFFLGPLSLASVRLACRALRDAATRGRRRVVLRLELRQGNPSMYIATACASPRVLQRMHTFHALRERVDKDQETGSTKLANLLWRIDSAARPDEAAYQHFMALLHTQLLTDIADEVVSLKIGQGWLAGDLKGGGLLIKPHVLLPQMWQLESLHLEGPLDGAILQELPALRHLTSLKLEHTCSESDIQGVCDTLALSRIDFEGIDEEEDFQSILAKLTSGKTAGLQELVLHVPVAEMQHLSRLSALTALTALSVKTSEAPGDLGGLPSITGLKSLRVDRPFYYDDDDTADVMLSLLTALTGLTLLDLNGDYDSEMDEETVQPSDLSVLSALTALRVLRCSFFVEAELVAGDPLPVELRFLRTAPALEVLDLGFWASFWSLPDASVHAVQDAVRGLLGVKQISVAIAGRELKQRCLPLSAFAAASSIETLSFTAHGLRCDGPEDMPAQARDCFKALTKLRSLSLGSDTDLGRVPHCDELLAGLPSTQLTSLCVNVSEADESVVQQIARFRDLQSLSMFSGRGSWPRGLEELCDLKCLTYLEVREPQEYRDPRGMRKRTTARKSLAFASPRPDRSLGTAIREYGSLVGFPVEVDVPRIRRVL